MTQLIQRAVNAIIRPPRKEYDQLSIPQYLQGEDGTKFIRHPIGFINKRNQPLVGSFYHGVNMSATEGGPCVMYLHGNASSQLEGQFLVPNLCPCGIYVCCFDFAGCGNSGGDYVSLGYFEKEDIEFLISQMHTVFNLGPFILWGRSMGAATALLVEHPLVVGRISDSAFTSIPDMCGAIATSMGIPELFVPLVVKFLQSQVVQTANFDIESVSPISINHQNEVPAVFGHGDEDQFIPFDQCRRLFDHYQNKQKFLMSLEGGHNDRRKKCWIRLGVSFIFDNMGIVIKDVKISSCRKLQESVFHFSSFSAMVNQTEVSKESEEIISEFQKEVEDEDEEEKDKKKKKRHHHKKDKKDENDEKDKKKRHHKKDRKKKSENDDDDAVESIDTEGNDKADEENEEKERRRKERKREKKEKRRKEKEEEEKKRKEEEEEKARIKEDDLIILSGSSDDNDQNEFVPPQQTNSIIAEDDY